MCSKILDRVLFFVLGMLIYFSLSYIYHKNDLYSFNQIINYNLDKIKPNENFEFANLLKDKQFIAIDTDLGNTARVNYVFHDKDNNELFTITDVGNRNLYVVTINGSSKTYRMIKDDK